jgi:hypothetical protein
MEIRFFSGILDQGRTDPARFFSPVGREFRRSRWRETPENDGHEQKSAFVTPDPGMSQIYVRPRKEVTRFQSLESSLLEFFHLTFDIRPTVICQDAVCLTAASVNAT